MKITALMLGGIICGLLHDAGNSTANVTVCELVAHPLKYRSRIIAVQGDVKGGLDGLLLSDRSCPNSPIELSISNGVAEKPNVHPLWVAIYRSGNIGTIGKHISTTALGRYLHRKSGWPKGVLEVDDVRNLKVGDAR